MGCGLAITARMITFAMTTRRFPENGGTLYRWMVFVRENPMKMDDDWRYQHFNGCWTTLPEVFLDTKRLIFRSWYRPLNRPENPLTKLCLFFFLQFALSWDYGSEKNQQQTKKSSNKPNSVHMKSVQRM